MAKNKPYKLLSRTDIKVFLLFLLDTIRYPIEHASLLKIMFENIESISIDFEECLLELVRDGHVYFDSYEGERFYMIAESGRAVSAELYDVLDETFRERVVRSVMRHMSLEKSETTVHSEIRECPDRRFEVILEASDKLGKHFSLSIVTSNRHEAERIRNNYETNPDNIYRGVLFLASGRVGYLN